MYVVILLLNTELCRELFYEGLCICAKRLIPSLLPFMIASGIILTAVSDLPAAARVPIIYVLGLFFGFPICARYASEMLSKGEIGVNTYKRLVCCGGGASFGFTVGACCNRFGFGRSILLYLICVLSAVLCSYLIPSDEQMYGIKITESAPPSVLSAISDAISDSTPRMLGVCGFVIFFYTLSGILCKSIDNAYTSTMLCGVLEFSTGCTRAMRISGDMSYVMCAAILSFSGSSLLIQCNAIAREFGIKELTKEYILLHALQAFLSAAMAFAVCKGRGELVCVSASVCVIIALFPFLQRIHKNKLKKHRKSSIISH